MKLSDAYWSVSVAWSGVAIIATPEAHQKLGQSLKIRLSIGYIRQATMAEVRKTYAHAG